MRVSPLVLPLAGLLAGGLACGPRTAQDRDREVAKATELVEEGGNSPFEGRLSFKSPESMAVQEVPYVPAKEAEVQLWNAWQRYRGQWTLRLTIGPKPTAKADPRNPMALDIENNGGMGRDFSRNLQRLMFEMKGFIRLRASDGREIEPTLVEFQRGFGMGRDRTFLLVFPKVHEGKSTQPPFEVRVREFGQGLGLLRFEVAKGPKEMSWRGLKALWKRTAKVEQGK